MTYPVLLKKSHKTGGSNNCSRISRIFRCKKKFFKGIRLKIVHIVFHQRNKIWKIEKQSCWTVLEDLIKRIQIFEAIRTFFMFACSPFFWGRVEAFFWKENIRIWKYRGPFLNPWLGVKSSLTYRVVHGTVHVLESTLRSILQADFCKYVNKDVYYNILYCMD